MRLSKNSRFVDRRAGYWLEIVNGVKVEAGTKHVDYQELKWTVDVNKEGRSCPTKSNLLQVPALDNGHQSEKMGMLSTLG